MNELKLKGQIEVILEDKNGNVKHREVKDNTITRAGLKYFLFQMMQASNISNVTRVLTGNVTSTAPSTFGIYAMRTPIEVDKNRFRPPFVDRTGINLHQDVVFYNVNGATTEALGVMIPSDTDCFMGLGDEAVFSIEYKKTTGSGTIQSVAIGKAYDSEAHYVHKLRDPKLPADVYTNSANYLLEHTDNGTIVHKVNAVSPTLRFAINLRTKEYVKNTNANSMANINNYFGGLVANDTIFKVAKTSASGTSYKATLTYVPNWRTSQTVKTLVLDFTTRTGMTVNASVQPLLVHITGENKLEVFVTASIGDHDGVVGANVQKAVVDVSDINNITYEIEDMGILPYSISGHSTAVATYLTGYYDSEEEKYCLPFYHRIAADGSFDTTLSSALAEGIVISKDFKTVYDEVCFRSSSSLFCAFVQADELAQVIVNSANTLYYTEASQMLSGTSLSAPVTKEANDILRIIYRYKLS